MEVDTRSAQELTTKTVDDFTVMMLQGIQNSLVAEKREIWHGKKTREPLLTKNTAGFLSHLLAQTGLVSGQLIQIQGVAEENNRLNSLRKLTADLSSGIRFAYRNPGKLPAAGTVKNTDMGNFMEGAFVWTLVTDPEKAMKMLESQTSGILGVDPKMQKQELQTAINNRLPIIQAARSQAAITKIQLRVRDHPFGKNIFPDPDSFITTLDSSMGSQGFNLAYQPPLHLRV